MPRKVPTIPMRPDDDYEYCLARITDTLAKRVPRDRLMTRKEWTALGIVKGAEWEHYYLHPECPSVVLLRRRHTEE